MSGFFHDLNNSCMFGRLTGLVYTVLLADAYAHTHGFLLLNAKVANAATKGKCSERVSSMCVLPAVMYVCYLRSCVCYLRSCVCYLRSCGLLECISHPS